MKNTRNNIGFSLDGRCRVEADLRYDTDGILANFSKDYQADVVTIRGWHWLSGSEELKRGEIVNVNPEPHPAIIVVAGVSSGAGKTLLAEAVICLLSRSQRIAAAKITVTHGTLGCPHGGKSCSVCSSLGGDYQIVTSKGILEQAGTDTARLKTSGADPVLWAITKNEAVGQAWEEMKKQLHADSVVVESNTLTSWIKPDLVLMIADPSVSRKIWKPSAERLIAEADLLVVNNRGTEKQREALLREIERLREDRAKVIFLNHPREVEGDQIMLDALSALRLDRHSDFCRFTQNIA